MSNLVCIAFDDPTTADRMLTELTALQKEYVIKLADACVVVRPPEGEKSNRWFRQGVTVTGLSLLVVSLPLAFLLWRSVEKGRIEQQTRQVLEQELQSWGAVEIADLKIRHELQEVEVLGTLYSRDPITEDQLNHCSASWMLNCGLMYPCV